ncbi:fanconi anemia group m protein [Lasius niger]|uniref:Fanconi anemia group m protein n=1 Tax=Lasius niger TaxID=67767 RepID=A0A0J7K200_LASNI|nr:fanconi anemia group m protein [Lasius niger]
MKPRGTSTPTTNRRVRLSLKRDKNQHPDEIDLSLFEAPSRCMNNTKDESILESNSPKQMFSSDKTIAQKIKRKHKDRNNAKNEFIDDEAEVDSDVSSDETIIIDEEEDLADFAPFISENYGRLIQTERSIRSFRHKYKIRIFMYDSFCVKEDVEPSILVDNDTILERAERELERNRRKHICSDKKTRHVKRQKTNHSESSEDEIEQLRIQVQED